MTSQAQDNGSQAMPQVSVIILTRNRPQFLVKAINSVLNQTFTDFEIIIVDDASTDETPQVIKSFEDKRIKSIRNNINRGAAGSRNEGLKIVKGEYVAFLDDDDEWLPQKLELQIRVLGKENRELGVVYTGYYKWDLDTGNAISSIIPQKKGKVSEDLFAQNWIGNSTVLVKHACFQDVGEYDENLPIGEDHDMWIRIAKKYEFDYIEVPLVKYGVHNQQITTNYRKKILGRERLIEKYEEFYSVTRKGQSDFWVTLGSWYCYDGNLDKGKKIFWFGIRNYPYDIRFYYNLCLALMGEGVFRKVKKIRDRL